MTFWAEDREAPKVMDAFHASLRVPSFALGNTRSKMALSQTPYSAFIETEQTEVSV